MVSGEMVSGEFGLVRATRVGDKIEDMKGAGSRPGGGCTRIARAAGIRVSAAAPIPVEAQQGLSF
jgi:hypothetical protein